ncbi:MAG: Type-2 restriction enzyme DpnII [Firmicutes bacterium ADurb.Bin080]|jgi:type II restriction enzyme|nr:MAG: Type-2 restriction enzyme DpnII [Firmicutes bacterium ADurb.Bin080]
MKKDFNQWLSQFKESIANYGYYIDFETVYKNISDIKVELNIMNSLVGSPSIEEDFKELVKKYPSVLKCIPILLAKREMSIFCMDQDGTFNYNFNKQNYSIDEYVIFMKKTGLFELIQKRLISNLYDYVLGVEAGLNSNGRKNRGGHLMEDLVESYIIKAGFIKDKTYFKEMYLSELEDKTGLNLSTLSNSGSTAKRFDFVILSNKCVYACECNFYASGGSKLNETARSYKTLALESKNIPGFKFVWFTDGLGWISARNNLKETFDVLDDIYCIRELEENLLKKF